MKFVVVNWVDSAKAIEAVGLKSNFEQEVSIEQIMELFNNGNDVALMRENVLAVDKGGKRFRQR